MKTFLFYQPNSENERPALDYLRDFSAQTGKTIQSINPDSREGADLCRLYDIMQYPALLVVDDQGHMQNVWAGGNLPTISEASYYVVDSSREPSENE